MIQRTFHEIYRAAVDGAPAAIEPANLHRLGIAVPAGEHHVRVWVDRTPTRLAWAAAVLGLVALVALARGAPRR